MANVLITGGEGFLGSHLADACVARGDRVTLLDHEQRQKKRFFPKEADRIVADFASEEARNAIYDIRPDVVFHLAAQTHVVHSVEHPEHDMRTNVLGTQKLFSWCADARVGKVVFASSGGAIYAGCESLPTPLLFDLHPMSPYGIAKQAGEYLLAGYAKESGLASMSLRFANLYGPRQQVMKPMGEGNVLALFLERLLVTGEPFTVFGDGKATRDYVYADDAVWALLLAAEKEATGVVNIASEKEVSLHELIQELFRIHGATHPLRYLPERPGEVRRSVLDATSAKDILGWQAKTPFAQGLAHMYAWYRDIFAR